MRSRLGPRQRQSLATKVDGLWSATTAEKELAVLESLIGAAVSLRDDLYDQLGPVGTPYPAEPCGAPRFEAISTELSPGEEALIVIGEPAALRGVKEFCRRLQRIGMVARGSAANVPGQDAANG